jgi:hypothetical protein
VVMSACILREHIYIYIYVFFFFRLVSAGCTAVTARGVINIPLPALSLILHDTKIVERAAMSWGGEGGGRVVACCLWFLCVSLCFAFVYVYLCAARKVKGNPR